MVAKSSVLVGVEIDNFLAICQVHISYWNVNSVDNFINFVALRSTKAASRAILQAGRICEGLEAWRNDVLSWRCRKWQDGLRGDDSAGTRVNKLNVEDVGEDWACSLRNLNNSFQRVGCNYWAWWIQITCFYFRIIRVRNIKTDLSRINLYHCTLFQKFKAHKPTSWFNC